MTDTREVNKASLRINREQAHTHFIAYTLSLVALYNAPINGRRGESRKRPLRCYASHYCIKCITDSIFE